MLFCELIEISGISFRNRVPKSSISNLWLQILFYNKLRYKYQVSPEISIGGLRIGMLCPFSLKIRLFTVFSANHGKNLKKQKMWKTIFRKKGIKSRCGGPRPKFPATPSFLIEISWKNISRSGGPYRRFGAFISKVETRNFCQVGKNVFFVLPFFWIGNKNNSVVFLGGPNFFLIKTY